MIAEATYDVLRYWGNKGQNTNFIKINNTGEIKLLQHWEKIKEWHFDSQVSHIA